MACLNLYHAVSSVTFYFYRYLISPNIEDKTIGGLDSDLHNIHRFMIFPIIDLLTAIGVLYLFYELDLRSESSKRSRSHARQGANMVTQDEPKMIDFRMNHRTS